MVVARLQAYAEVRWQGAGQAASWRATCSSTTAPRASPSLECTSARSSAQLWNKGSFMKRFHSPSCILDFLPYCQLPSYLPSLLNCSEFLLFPLPLPSMPGRFGMLLFISWPMQHLPFPHHVKGVFGSVGAVLSFLHLPLIFLLQAWGAVIQSQQGREVRLCWARKCCGAPGNRNWSTNSCKETWGCAKLKRLSIKWCPDTLLNRGTLSN